MFKFKEAPQLKYFVTFIPNKREPIHNWYYYKEGFSKQLVDILLENFQVTENQTVLDPFAGVGTTLLACKQKGIKSIGFDISPLCAFVSKVKTAEYNLDELNKAVIAALKWKFQKPEQIPSDKWLRKVFSSYALEDLIFYKSKIFEIENESTRNFLLLALLDSAMQCSYAYKDGALVKVVKRGVAPLGKMFKYKIRRMLKDLRKNPSSSVEAKTQIADARELPLEDNSIDFVITSPPYLNKIEYTQIFRTEYALFFNMPETKLRSFIGETSDENMEGFEGMPPIAQAYFKDMRKAMSELYRVCKKGARLAIVIGGGCFPDMVINVDEVLAKISQEVGFTINSILVARNSWCTKSRIVKVGQIRESIIMMEKR